MFARLSVVVFLAAFAGAAQAQNLPAKVQEHVDELLAECREFGGDPVPEPGFVSSVDLNGDGGPDVLVDLSKMNCQGALSAFCGSAGCPLIVWLSGPEGYFAAGPGHVHEWQVEGRSLRVTIHGQMCNPLRIGADSCVEVVDYDGLVRPPRDTGG